MSNQARQNRIVEIELLKMWQRAGFVKVYRYKYHIKGLMDVGSQNASILTYDIDNEYFHELKDLADDERLVINDVAMTPETLLARRTGEVSESTKLDHKLFRDAKFALRRASSYMKRFNNPSCVVLINWYNYEAKFFYNKESVTDHLLKEMKEWDSVSAGEDEELEVITFCSESMKRSHAPTFDHYKPFRKINGEMVYRHRRPVKFEEIVEYYPSF